MVVFDVGSTGLLVSIGAVFDTFRLPFVLIRKPFVFPSFSFVFDSFSCRFVEPVYSWEDSGSFPDIYMPGKQITDEVHPHPTLSPLGRGGSEEHSIYGYT